MSVGNQIVTLKYYDPANSGDVNRRFQGIRPVGIYSGGYLTPSDGSHVDLSPLVCEISDGNYQVRVETTIVVNLSVPFADNKPYVVLHWTYVGLVSDYMEILVVNAPADNDIVVGKCTYSGGGVLNGVIYSERTTPNTLDLFLKVEPGSVSKSIRVRRGRKYVGTAVQEIDEQYTSISLSTYSAGNIVYIYVNDAGGLAHSKTASDYNGKLLLAKVVIPNPFNSISVDDIIDVRSFLMDPVVPDGTSIEKNVTTGKLQVKDSGITSAKMAAGAALRSSGALIFNDSSPTTFTDLDLSSVVGANVALVYLKVLCNSGDDNYYTFRTNGETADVSALDNSLGSYRSKIDHPKIGYFLVQTDSSGIIEWKGGDVRTTQITIMSYLK